MMQTSGKEQNTNYVSNANEKKKKKDTIDYDKKCYLYW